MGECHGRKWKDDQTMQEAWLQHRLTRLGEMGGDSQGHDEAEVICTGDP